MQIFLLTAYRITWYAMSDMAIFCQIPNVSNIATFSKALRVARKDLIVYIRTPPHHEGTPHVRRPKNSWLVEIWSCLRLFSGMSDWSPIFQGSLPLLYMVHHTFRRILAVSLEVAMWAVQVRVACSTIAIVIIMG